MNMFKTWSKQLDNSSINKLDFKQFAVERHAWLKVQIKNKKVEVHNIPDSEDDISELEFEEGQFIDLFDSKKRSWVKSTVLVDLGDMIKV